MLVTAARHLARPAAASVPAMPARGMAKKSSKKPNARGAHDRRESAPAAATAAPAFALSNVQRDMDAALAALQTQFATLRSGSASASLLDSVMVPAYGTTSRLNQVAQVVAKDARMLAVNVFDPSLVRAVEKSIRDADLNLNPVVDANNVVRVPVPKMSQEYRREMVRAAASRAESIKVSVRRIRRDAMEVLKARKTSKLDSEDDVYRHEQALQRLTDDKIKQITTMLEAKQREITGP